ncbi:hypothetical protein AAC387_Pa03g1701 [Persea americana]
MLRACVSDFKTQWDETLPLYEFANNNSYHSSIGMAPLEALYGRRCRTPVCYEELGVRIFHGPAIVSEISDKVKFIQERLKVARSKQKSYADSDRRDLQFRKEIRLALPPELSSVHNIFHVSMLKKYVPDPLHVFRHEPLEIKEDATYVGKPIQIIDTKEQELRTWTIHWVKVLWENHGPEEVTWE